MVAGIDYYTHISALSGCVDDAHAVKAVLERHSDGSVNFSVQLLTATSINDVIGRASLKERVRELFADDSEIALFYFAGHGHVESTGGYLCATDCKTGDDGLALGEVLTLANKSKARNKIIVLDSCHSGIAGAPATQSNYVELSEGLTVLTASTAEQYAKETATGGVFTTLFVDALQGAASNLVGEVTPGSVYAHIDQSLGPWDQRPVFKTNVKSFVSLRKVQPPISLSELRRLAEFFPHPGYEFVLDPGYEPESAQADPKKTPVFAILQRMNRVNLVVPLGAAHMYHAAMEHKSCKLTVLGEHYRRLAVASRI